jgi:hypothetical protein
VICLGVFILILDQFQWIKSSFVDQQLKQKQKTQQQKQQTNNK